ncbi:MAG: ABC transporter permease [Planctomycetes bacterium]|nr:ABC transporter permease [Planctomycetota bacterium]
MSKFLHLVVRNALRNRLRTVLTAGGSAFLLFVLVFMLTALTEMYAWEGAPATHLRVAVQHSTGLATPLPIELENYLRGEEISACAGHLIKLNWFGGYYQDRRNFFANFASDHKEWREVWDELSLPDELYKKWCSQKNAMVVGRGLAKRLGWKVGQQVTLMGTIYPVNPELEIVGCFTGPTPREEEQLFFRWDYLDELLGGRKVVGTFWIRARTLDDVARLKDLIDGHTKNSSDPTETMTEKEFGQQFAAMMGNIKGMIAILGSIVLVILVFMTANTVAMSARERVTEIAVLRTLGFRRSHILFLVVAESVLVTLAGALFSLGIALVLFNWLLLSPSPQFPVFLVEPGTIAVALGAAVLCGSLSALVPAIQSARRKIVDGLRYVG